jgi:hypothetical protein
MIAQWIVIQDNNVLMDKQFVQRGSLFGTSQGAVLKKTRPQNKPVLGKTGYDIQK